MSFSCSGPSGSPSPQLYWLPLLGHSCSATQQDNGSITDLAQTPTVLCSSSDWCSSWGYTGSWACTSARSSTRTGTQDPRSNQQQKQTNASSSILFQSPDSSEYFSEPKLSTTRPPRLAGW